MSEDVAAIAAGLSSDARAALMGAHRLSNFTDDRAVYHRNSEVTLEELWQAKLICGVRRVTPLGLAVRVHLEQQS